MGNIKENSVLFFSLRQEVFHFLSNLWNIFQFVDFGIKSALSPAFAIQQITEPEEEIELNLFATSACKMFSTICNIGISIVFNDVQRQHINCFQRLFICNTRR